MTSPQIALDFPRYQRRAARIREDHRTLRGQYESYWALYHKIHWKAPPLDESDYQVVLPIHTITVNTAHAILTGMAPQLHVYPNRPDSDTDVKRADKIEQWHLAVDAVCAEERGEDQWEAACFNQAQYGVGVLREVYDFPRGWSSGEIPQGQLDHYPIVQHALDPRQVFFEFGSPPRGLFSTVFYECEMTVGEILWNYPDANLQLRLDADGNAMPQDFDEYRTVVDFWEWAGGKIWHSVFAEIVGVTGPEQDAGQMGQFLKEPTPMPEYYILPYHIFAFHQTTERRPEGWGLSVLYPLTDLPHYLEILASRQMRREDLYTDPILLAHKGQNSPAGQIATPEKPGDVVDLEAGDNLSYLQWQGTGPDSDRLWQKLDDLIHELSFLTRALAGGGPSEVTGFKSALDRETSILKMSKAIQNYERVRATVYKARSFALGKLSPNTAVTATVIDQDGAKARVALMGKVLERYLDITVEVKPTFPGDRQREVNVAQQAIAAKIWSLSDGMEYAPPANGASKEATRQRVVQDQIEFSPIVLQARAQQLATVIQMETQQMMQSKPQSVRDAIMNPGQPSPGGIQGLPGSMPGPGPAGASPNTPVGSGISNALRPAGGTPTGLPVGTITPPSLNPGGTV